MPSSKVVKAAQITENEVFEQFKGGSAKLADAAKTYLDSSPSAAVILAANQISAISDGTLEAAVKVDDSLRGVNIRIGRVRKRRGSSGYCWSYNYSIFPELSLKARSVISLGKTAVSSPKTPSSTLNELITRAIKLFEEKKYEEVVELLYDTHAEEGLPLREQFWGVLRPVGATVSVVRSIFRKEREDNLSDKLKILIDELKKSL